MDINDLIKKELISICHDEFKKEDVISYLGNILLENQYIKKEYINDVLEREESFPTGLELKDIGIAIPHANPNNVLKNGISIARLKKKALFLGMETGEEIYADIVFMLALKNSNDHIKMLQNLFLMLQKEEIMQSLMNANDENEIENIVINNLENNLENN